LISQNVSLYITRMNCDVVSAGCGGSTVTCPLIPTTKFIRIKSQNLEFATLNAKWFKCASGQ